MARDTLARVTLWLVFLASFGVPKGEKNFIGGTKEGKNVKKIVDPFSLKSDDFFFKFFPLVPPMKSFVTLWYPKESKKNFRAQLKNIF